MLRHNVPDRTVSDQDHNMLRCYMDSDSSMSFSPVLAEVFLTFFQKTATEQKHTVSCIQSDISFISLQSFQIIIIRKIGCMTILLNMKSCQIKFFTCQDFLWIFCRLCRFRNLRNLLFKWSKFYKFSSLCVKYADSDICLLSA